ncbi:hypothetical protein AQ919_18170 [Burkholderia pseudomallei]|nr:hypothetical protein AQ919_18170 [Burkholderia pseudomallei]ONC69456.1 hypothetical protein AQ921_21290 [Burkholderia pseudomallei]
MAILLCLPRSRILYLHSLDDGKQLLLNFRIAQLLRSRRIDWEPPCADWSGLQCGEKMRKYDWRFHQGSQERCHFAEHLSKFAGGLLQFALCGLLLSLKRAQFFELLQSCRCFLEGVGRYLYGAGKWGIAGWATVADRFSQGNNRVIQSLERYLLAASTERGSMLVKGAPTVVSFVKSGH